MKKIIVSIITFVFLLSTNHVFSAACPPIFCPPPSAPDPIILIPGIGGSWNWSVMLHGVLSDDWDFTIGTKTYQPFIEALEAQGKVEGQDFFVAHYDWRKPNYDSARDYLMPVIDKAKAVSGSSKVDIVAHSMGGLVARSYIQNSDLYRFDVDELILNGTPNYGSSDVYNVWEGGRIPKNWEKRTRRALGLYLSLLTFSNNPKTWYNKIHSDITSVAELLPVYNYVYDIEVDSLKNHSQLVEQNPILGGLNSDFSTLVFNIREVNNIVGKKQPTVKQIPVRTRTAEDEPLWVDGKPDPLDPERNDTEGDNRVLLSSANIPGVSSLELPFAHGDLISGGSPAIFSFLEMNDPGNVPLPNEPDEALLVWFASPVQPKITDPNGNYITKNFSNIPAAEYDGEADPNGVKLIYIPNPLTGEYQIELTGSGNGEYHMGTSFMSDEHDKLIIDQGNITNNQIINYTINLDSTSQEEPITTQLADTTPPTIEIISPEQNKSYLNSGNLEIDFNVSDDESGVASSNTKLDGQTVIDTQIIDLSLIGLGNHELKVEAEDNTGNIAESMVLFETHTTLDALKDNLEYYWQKGLITRFGTYIKLKAKLIGLTGIFEAKSKLKTKADNVPWYLKHAFNKGLNGLNKAISKHFNQFIKEVKKAKGKSIDSNAADLLVEQVEYLQDSL